MLESDKGTPLPCRETLTLHLHHHRLPVGRKRKQVQHSDTAFICWWLELILDKIQTVSQKILKMLDTRSSSNLVGSLLFLDSPLMSMQQSTGNNNPGVIGAWLWSSSEKGYILSIIWFFNCKSSLTMGCWSTQELSLLICRAAWLCTFATQLGFSFNWPWFVWNMIHVVDKEAQPLYPENQFYFISNSWNALQHKY